jgi:hypothetical protein
MTAYGLHKASEGRMSFSTAYRLAEGEFRAVSEKVIEALCDIFEIKDLGPLFVRERGRPTAG